MPKHTFFCYPFPGYPTAFWSSADRCLPFHRIRILFTPSVRTVCVDAFLFSSCNPAVSLFLCNLRRQDGEVAGPDLSHPRVHLRHPFAAQERVYLGSLTSVLLRCGTGDILSIRDSCMCNVFINVFVAIFCANVYVYKTGLSYTRVSITITT